MKYIGLALAAVTPLALATNGQQPITNSDGLVLVKQKNSARKRGQVPVLFGKEQWDKLTRMAMEMAYELGYDPEDLPIDRAFTGVMNGPGDTIGQITDYGCWCYFFSNVGRGRGEPQDNIDALCKVLADGYTCITIDSEEETGGSCSQDPWDIEYNDIIGQTGGTYYDLCSANNPGDNCAIRSCVIETQFIRDLVTGYLFGNTIDESLKHENGFDHASVCNTVTTTTNAATTVTDAPATEPSGGGEVEATTLELGHLDGQNITTTLPTGDGGDVGGGVVIPPAPVTVGPTTDVPIATDVITCCGEYPSRYPFHNQQGSRLCCGAVTYNPGMLECCDESKSKTKVSC